MLLGLLVTDGPKKGNYIELPDNSPFWVGRQKNLDFVIEEASSSFAVSAIQCCFLRKGSELALKDQSKNGTRINGSLLCQTTLLLRNADLISIGNIRFQVVDLDKNQTNPLETVFEFELAIKELIKRKNRISELDEKIGPYLRIEEIGSGAFGKIYKAVHCESKTLVALKVLSNLRKQLSEENFGRFLRETALLKKIAHEGVIRLYEGEVTEVEGQKQAYLALEYFQGTDLNSYIKCYGSLSWKKALRILYKVIIALDYIHSKGVIHRDLKPHNLMYNPILEIPKIIDLGLGKCVLEEDRATFYITNPGSGLGTPNYMPLEQWEDATQIDERSDIYSLGATLYYLLTQTHPYEEYKDLRALYLAIYQEKLRPIEQSCRKKVPQEFLEIIKKMMASKVEDRYPTSRKVKVVLQKVAEKLKVRL
jgi:serine/threonine protein kinase